MKWALREKIIQLNWRKMGLITLISAPLLMVIIQFIYPFDRTMLFSSVSGQPVGGLSREEASAMIKQNYNTATLGVYFGERDEPYRTPTLAALGVKVESDSAVEKVLYPWWLRLVPTSLWWGHVVSVDTTASATLDEDIIRAYASEELGDSCKIDPKNASIIQKDGTLTLQPSEDGGTCEIEEVIQHIQKANISLTHQNKVEVSMKRIAPTVDDAMATELIGTISGQLEGGIPIKVGDEEVVVLNAADVSSWLEFPVVNSKLTVSVSDDTSRSALTKQFDSKVAVKPGVLTITTKDFEEVSRSGGGEGRALNVADTAKNISSYLMKQTDEISVATSVIQPEKKYIRSYSPTDTGLSAMIKHYTETHKGSFGVSLIELSGQRRRAGFNEDKKFTTASTYKLYVAYSTLRRVEKGDYKWTDTINGGRNLSKCFDDMIVLSDNPCSEALVQKIGYNALHQDVVSLGLNNTSFVDKESFKTSAGDLSTFMASLESGQLPLSKDSRNRLISALKRNVFRQGIPAGAEGSVADKVGFLDGLLHDAAIVYSSSGTYVLSVMTDNSSWSTIADLTKEIQSLRSR